MWHKWWDGGQWRGWQSLEGQIQETPSYVSWGANRLDCFARGSSNEVWHKWWDGRKWGGWQSLGCQIKNAPECVSWGANRLDSTSIWWLRIALRSARLVYGMWQL